MGGYFEPPVKIPLLIRIGIAIAERKLKKRLYPARILSWYPKAALGAGVMEGLVAHSEGAADERLLKLLRMQVSFMSSCPFCIDMNSFQYDTLGIDEAEILALQGVAGRTIEESESFSEKEKTALRYARALTGTPISIEPDLLEKMLSAFTEKEFVVIASTIAQVNYWTRLIQGIGVPPAGFTEKCSILNLENYKTLNDKDKN